MSATMPSAVSQRPSSLWHLMAVALLLTASIGVQVVRDRGWRPYAPVTPIMWLQSAELVKRASLGFRNLVADIYWIRAVVYYGGQQQVDAATRDFSLLSPFLTFVTTLDPQFRVAYRFGAIFLTEPPPDGPGRPDLAIALLERGMRANPTEWEYAHDIGFVYYWWLQDYKTAAQWFTRASELPGATNWLAPLAATTLAQGGDRQSSRLLWRQLGESDTQWIRQNAQQRLNQLDAMDMVEELRRAAERFRLREGRLPLQWDEFVAKEGLRGVPVDAAGVPFSLHPETGYIDIDRRSPLYPLPWPGSERR
jgi:hypothetical protein